jgi:hypothetical protein
MPVRSPLVALEGPFSGFSGFQPRRMIPVAGTALVVGCLAAANGGYFPTSWGWALLLLSLAMVWCLALDVAVRPSRLEATFVVGLLGVAFWSGVSAAWSPATDAFAEVARSLVYVVGAAVAVMAARRSPALVLGGALTGAAAAAAFALGTRLFPRHVGGYDVVAADRLSRPVGYWNGLGLLCVLSILLALALALHGRRSAAATAGVVPLLAVTLYFTFSRASWIALAAGIGFAIALSRRRVQFSLFLVSIGVPSALGVWLASRSSGLTHQHAAVHRAAQEGQRLAVVLAGLMLASSALGWATFRVTEKITVPFRVDRMYALALAVVMILVACFGIANAGGPSAAGHRAWRAFNATPPKTNGDLRKRLFSFSGNGRVYTWRAALKDFRAHPLVGSGAGSYESYWLSHRRNSLKVRDAHSLYLETSAELGAVGIILLLVGLGAPLLAALRAREHVLVPSVTGAYVAFLLHAGVDWDWELPAVTLLAIACGAAILVCGRESPSTPLPALSRYALGLAAAGLATLGFIWLAGNMLLTESSNAAQSANWGSAEQRARQASRWLPWSSQPWEQVGEAELSQGRSVAAEDDFRRAIAKDSRDWNLWLDLARATTGVRRRSALEVASMLNPRSPEIAAFRSDLDGLLGITITAENP